MRIKEDYKLYKEVRLLMHLRPLVLERAYLLKSCPMAQTVSTFLYPQTCYMRGVDWIELCDCVFSEQGGIFDAQAISIPW